MLKLNLGGTGILRLVLAVFLMAMVLIPGAAHASWWNHDWSMRKAITIDTGSTGAAITGQIGTVPVLIRLDTGDFSFDTANQDGSDIRFVAADNTSLMPAAKLAYQLARQSAMNSQWVNEAARQARLQRIEATYAEQMAALRGDAPR